MTTEHSDRPEWATVSRYADFHRHITAAENAVQNARAYGELGTEAYDPTKTLDAIDNAIAALTTTRAAINEHADRANKTPA